MKKTIISFIGIIICKLLSGQECTTTWPYLYSDFVEGKVFYKSGNTEPKFLNIYIIESKLHFIHGENINELLSSTNIDKVEIAHDTYIPFGNKFYRLISKGEKGSALVLLASGDLYSLSRGSGAYGSSANSGSTQQLTSLDVRAGILAGNVNHLALRQSKDEGKSIPIVQKHYFFWGGEMVAATAKDVEKSLLSEDRRAFKGFVKANKIKWNRVDDLVKLLAIL